MLETEFLGLKMKNPLFLASGIQGVTKANLEEVCKFAGAVICKSLTLETRKGHETPIMVETNCGFLNAVGYSNPGIDAGLEEFFGWKKKEPLILSITARTVTEYETLAEKISHKIKDGMRIDAFEVVLSCPHTPEYGLMAGQQTPETASEIVKAIKKHVSTLPLILKISPGIPGEVEVAKAVEHAGANAIDVGNTIGPGMVIDIERHARLPGFGMGGLSGPAMRPIAIRCVYDIYNAVKIPIIGCGGITYGKDAIEFMQAGASVVAIGTAVYYRGTNVFSKIAKEMEKWLHGHNYSSVKEIVGLAHK
ncbi:dihydroorotate dehydrogenase [Candidatus Micrarchaeota archaeon]|nr:dihydroorotate dehydrogenase [Candidatus Micrarchaeota archaeon]